MQELARKQGGLVLDTWAMAWIYDGNRPLVRVWIESDQTSRTRKCYVSQGDEKGLTLEGCNELINRKDGETRDKFLRRLHFDLFTDRERYDIVLDNTKLIPEETGACAQLGIGTFSPVVLEAVGYALKKIGEPNFDPDHSVARDLTLKYDGMIKRLGEFTRRHNEEQ